MTGKISKRRWLGWAGNFVGTALVHAGYDHAIALLFSTPGMLTAVMSN
jgi:hypothetical protein